MKAKVAEGSRAAQSCTPKSWKHEHRPPVIKSRLLQPGVAVKIRSNAGAQPALDGGRGVKPHQHLVSDLRVARLIGSHQAQSVAAEERGDPVDEKEDRENQKRSHFADPAPARQAPVQFIGGVRIGWLKKRLKVAQEPTGQPFPPAFGRVLRGWFLKSFHFQRFSSGRSHSQAMQGSVMATGGGRPVPVRVRAPGKRGNGIARQQGQG